MNFRKNIQEPASGFQMAPMVDVMFLLLIFFMVASIYAQWENRVGIKVPKVDTGVNAKRLPDEIIVNIDEEGKFFINNVEQSVKQLHEILEEVAEVFAKNPNQIPSVIIRADAKTDHEHVMEVMDVCRKTGITQISFATQKEEEKK